MATASYVKFTDFVQSLGLKEHNLSSDVLKVYLSNEAPIAATDADKADIAEITIENGYTGPVDIQADWVAGVLTAVNDPIVITASGGTVGPFRYVILYNDTHASDGLIAYWDYASSVTLQIGESFTIDFGATIFTLA